MVGILEYLLVVVGHEDMLSLGVLGEHDARDAYSGAEFNDSVVLEGLEVVEEEVAGEDDACFPEVEAVVPVGEDELVVEEELGLGGDEDLLWNLLHNKY